MFGGYAQKPATTDHVHKSRVQCTGPRPDVQVTATTKLLIRHDYF